MMNINDNFLDLLKPNLDDKQKDALRAERNAVIAAGAGSGKTQVLATRFAWLIMTDQAKIDEILTLTFTNKAASEMYQRIYQTLSFFANHELCENLTEKNKNLAIVALNNFSNAHIQTLDSYCGGIVRQCANRYGIKPDFTTGSADSASDIKNQAFKFVLKNKANKAIQTFAKPGKLQDFAENIIARTIENYTNLATEDEYFLKKLDIQLSEITEAWNYYVLGYVKDSPFTLDTEIENTKEHINNIRIALNESSKKNDLDKAAYVESVENALNAGDYLSNLPKITIEDIKNNTDKLKESLNAEKNLVDLISIIPAKSGYIGTVRSAITPLKKLIQNIKPIEVYIAQYDSILELNKLFDSFLKDINSSKRTSGNLSFSDITALALKMLLENEDIRNQEKTSFKKIMIDEFQDNNGKNRDLLYLISLKQGEFEDNGQCKITINKDKSLLSQIVIRNNEDKIIEDKRSPNKLFFVGDEKQSIYKFRGADVSVFNELTKDKENDLIPMNYNYRSSAALLTSFNTIFHGGNDIFLSPESKVDFEAYYKEDALKNGEKLPVLTEQNVPVHVNLLNTNKYKKLLEDYDFIPEKEQLAYYMAKKIYEIGKESKGWNKIAILDRSRTDRNIITKYLSMFNIPYEVDQFGNIFEDGIINDFYNFFRICVYPSDINSYASYLASPLCGLSVNSVEIVLSHLIAYAEEKSHLKANGNQNEIAFTPFPEDEHCELLIKNDLTDKEYKKYMNGKSFFYKSKSKVLQDRITTTLSDLWHKKGYKYETYLTQQTKLAAEQFDLIFELGRQADSEGKSVSWFVDQLEILKKSYFGANADIDAKGITYPTEKKAAVQIMTIHKSKGLQFENVFVYGCFTSRFNDKNEDIYYSDKYGITIKLENGLDNYFYKKTAQLNKEKNIAEFRRLIYVALTRAIDSVYIIGSWDPAGNKSEINLLENAARKYYQDIEDDYSFNAEAGFDYTEIKPVEYKELPDINSRTPIDNIREDALNNTESAYENAEIIKYECNPIERKTPSSLEPDFTTGEQADRDSGAKYEDAPDLLVSSDFSAADFGTLVHAYLEAQANGISPESFEPPVSMYKNLTESKIEEYTKQCIEMTKQFDKSTMGQKLKNCKAAGNFFRAEWGFRMMYEDSIFTGSIDLIFSNGDGTYTIVDYKSDNQKNPEKYLGQQHCYRAAASKLLGVEENKIALYLYYTKMQETVELN